VLEITKLIDGWDHPQIPVVAMRFGRPLLGDVMLPLSLTTGYAVRALQCLQDPGGRTVPVEEVAGFTGIPRFYLSKLIHKLVKNGLVVARRGRNGGVVLARPAAEIMLEELSDAIDGGAWRKRGLMGLLGRQETAPLALQEFWPETLTQLLAHLRSVTLADLLQKHDPSLERFRADRGMDQRDRTRPERPLPDGFARTRTHRVRNLF
jgi:Rrf2 family protein